MQALESDIRITRFHRSYHDMTGHDIRLACGTVKVIILVGMSQCMEQYFEGVTISQAHQDFLERLDALKEAEHAERAPGTNARRATPHRHQRAKPHRHQRAEPHPSARARARATRKTEPARGRTRPPRTAADRGHDTEDGRRQGGRSDDVDPSSAAAAHATASRRGTTRPTSAVERETKEGDRRGRRARNAEGANEIARASHSVSFDAAVAQELESLGGLRPSIPFHSTHMLRRSFR